MLTSFALFPEKLTSADAASVQNYKCIVEQAAQ